MNKYIYLILLGAISQPLFSQTKPQQKGTPPVKILYALKGIGKPYTNKISLRWNISKADKMNYLAETGVYIDRLIIDENNKTEKNWVRITPLPVKAFSKEELLSPENKRDTGMAAIHKCLYEPTKFPKVGFLEDIKNQTMDAENRYVILSLFASEKGKNAIAAGLGYDDMIQVDSNKSYVYRITIASGDKSISAAFIYIYGKALNSVEYLDNLEASGNDQSITLKWNGKNKMFNGYWMERSRDGKNFERINKLIYMPTIDTVSYNHYYADSVGNYTKFQYRILGLNSFGEYTVSNITPFVYAKDMTPPGQPFLKAGIKDNKINLTWTQPEDNDLEGYYILYGKKTNKTDSLLSREYFKPKTNEYSIPKPENFKYAYYRILALDTAKNISYSNSSYVFVSDQIPPRPPNNLQGIIDTAGVAYINWAVDTTDDIIGYKVFFANQEDHVFTAVSNIIDINEATDTVTLKTLTEYVYYKVVAIDQNYNHSKMSNVLKLKRPDKVPPPEPVILNYTVSQNRVSFNWSPVKATDFLKYNIYRRKSGETKWELLTALIATEFIDSNLLESTIYEYAVTAIDNSNLSSAYSFPLAVKTGMKQKTENIRLHKAEKVADSKQWYLLWNSPVYPVNRVLIYKKINGGFINTTSVNGKYTEYNIAKEDVGLEFAIRLLYLDGTESELIEVLH